MKRILVCDKADVGSEITKEAGTHSIHIPSDYRPLHCQRMRTAMDIFFRTLADTHGSCSTAIVLSGLDRDGSIGIKRIKENGGLTVAQDPGEAEQEGMPRSAIETGLVDWVLPVAEIPQRLLEYQRIQGRVRLPEQNRVYPRTSSGAGERTQIGKKRQN